MLTILIRLLSFLSFYVTQQLQQKTAGRHRRRCRRELRPRPAGTDTHRSATHNATQQHSSGKNLLLLLLLPLPCLIINGGSISPELATADSEGEKNYGTKC